MYDADELKMRSRMHAAWNRNRVISRAGNHCEICDEDIRFVVHVHHIRPVEVLGCGDMENLIALCPTCHEILGKLLHARKVKRSDRWYAVTTWLAAHPRYTEQQVALMTQLAHFRTPFVNVP